MTRPGTTVPMRIVRNKQERTVNITVDELDLDAEQNQAQAQRPNDDNAQPNEEQSGGFGLTLQDLTPGMARRLQVPGGRSGAVITDVDPDSGSAMAGIRPGDVILSVNGTAVSSAADASRELMKVPSGRLGQVLLWRDGSEVFVPVRKD
jgi:S1-C subfamily serine protease